MKTLTPTVMSMPDSSTDIGILAWLLDASAWIIPVLTAIIFHEVAHGWMAEKFGDKTARILGRITLNPIKHVDIFGSIVMPAILIVAQSPMLFGYAKPVPVDFSRLEPRRLGMCMVALAGPVTNVILAFITGLLLHIESFVTPEQAPWLFLNLYRMLILNCGLAVFNMLPIMPLDGGRVVYSFLRGAPQRWFGKLERRGILFVFALLLCLQFVGVGIADIIGEPVFLLLKTILLLTGNNH